MQVGKEGEKGLSTQDKSVGHLGHESFEVPCQNIGHLIPVGGAATFTYLNTARIFLGSVRVQIVFVQTI